MSERQTSKAPEAKNSLNHREDRAELSFRYFLFFFFIIENFEIEGERVMEAGADPAGREVRWEKLPSGLALPCLLETWAIFR